MVPDPRSWLDGPRRALRGSRTLSLLLAFAFGGGALALAVRYAHVRWYEWVLLPLGVGGSTYYLAHYAAANWRHGSKGRAFLRNFAMILLANALVPESVPIAEGVVSIATIFGVMFFVALTVAVDVGTRADEGDDEASEGGEQVDAVPPWERREWFDGR